MKVAVTVIGILVMILGGAGVILPRMLVRFVDRVIQSRFGQYVLAGLRFILGAILVFAASECRFPNVIRFLGILSIGAGIVTAMFSREIFAGLIAWWNNIPAGAIRALCVLATGFGVFLFYAATS